MKKIILLMTCAYRNTGIFPARERKAYAGYYEFQISIVVLQPGHEVL